jgi:L-amino acid N-acyltransferase YncA
MNDSAETPYKQLKMEIRLAEAADLAAIVVIYNASIPDRRATADLEPVLVESRWSWFENHSPTHYPLWVAVSKGEILGWLGLQAFYGRSAYWATAEVSLYVHPAAQRQGVGRRLLGWAIQASPEVGVKTLLGFIFAHNQPSLRLFKQQQFQP